MARCDEAVRTEAAWSPIDVLNAADDRIDEILAIARANDNNILKRLQAIQL